MTCKDCIHYEVCEAHERVNGIIANLCGLFKNKADFVEVKCAVWKEVKQTGKNSRPIKYTTKQCSACGYWNGRRITNYCPHCGATMIAGHPPVEGKKISVGKFSYGERKEQ